MKRTLEITMIEAALEDFAPDTQQELDEAPVSCPMCDGNDSTFLGTLGKRKHLRCNTCGWEFSFIPE